MTTHQPEIPSFIPSITRHVTDYAWMHNALHEVGTLFGNSFDPINPSGIFYFLLLPEEINRIRQLDTARRNLIADELSRISSPRARATENVLTEGVSLYAKHGKGSRRGYSVLLDISPTEVLDEERDMVTSVLQKSGEIKLPDLDFRHQIMLGKLYISLDRKDEAKETLSDDVFPKVLQLGRLVIETENSAAIR